MLHKNPLKQLDLNLLRLFIYIFELKNLTHTAEALHLSQSLRQRLSNRGQDSQEVIEKRLAGSVNEMSQYVNFDYVVINDNFDVALAELKSIIIANRLTLAKQQERHAGRIEQLLSE
jgi:ribose 1,5-bisphosphokinase PhnN